MAKNGYKIFDSDMHVTEPADLWLRYIDPKHRDRAPIGTNDFMTDVMLVQDGTVIARLGQDNPGQSDVVELMGEESGRVDLFKDYERRGWDPACQLEAMEHEGIDVTVLFPSRGLFAHARQYDDDDLAAAISRAYNDWLAEFCAAAPERMYGAAMLPAQDVSASIHEARRAKRDLGFKAVFLRPNPVRGRNWHNPVYDPLWAECESLDLTVCFHEATPCELPVAMADRFDGVHEDIYSMVHVACHPVEQMYASLCMVMGGVCERFPNMRIGFLEANCSWVPFWLWRMDEHHEQRGAALRDRLPLPPSEYFKRQCYVSIEPDETPGRYTADWLEGSNIVFSTDFPHADSRYPHAVETFIDQRFLPETAMKKILWDNSAELYGFDSRP